MDPGLGGPRIRCRGRTLRTAVGPFTAHHQPRPAGPGHWPALAVDAPRPDRGPADRWSGHGTRGPSAAFTVAGLLFALSLPLLLTTRIRSLEGQDAMHQPGPPGTAGKDLLDGLRYIRRHRLIGPLVVVGAICELGLTGTFNVGMVSSTPNAAGPLRLWLDHQQLQRRSGRQRRAARHRRLAPSCRTDAGRDVARGLPGAATIALVPVLWLAAVLAAVIGLNAGVFGSLDKPSSRPRRTRPTSAVSPPSSCSPSSVSPPSATRGRRCHRGLGAAPVFVGCGIFAGLGVVIALSYDAVRHAELPAAATRDHLSVRTALRARPRRTGEPGHDAFDGSTVPPAQRPRGTPRDKAPATATSLPPAL